MAVAPGIIDQSITAGGQWDGTVPPGTPADASGIRTYPAAATGGLFRPDYAAAAGSFETYVVDKIQVDFAAAATSQVAIKDDAGNTFVLASPGSGPYLYLGPLELAWDEYIEVTSAVSASVMHGRVHTRPGRSRPASF